MPLHFSPVAPARPAAIGDRQLEQLTRIAHDAPHGLASEAEAEWMLSCNGALLEELRRWRAWGAGQHITPDALNVITLPVAR